jgi:hypothetical protein
VGDSERSAARTAVDAHPAKQWTTKALIAVADAERRAAISAPFPVTFHGAMTEVCRAFPPAAKKFRYSLSVNLHACPRSFRGEPPIARR